MTTKDKKQLVILAISVIILVLLLINHASNRKKKGYIGAVAPIPMPMQNINMPTDGSVADYQKDSEETLAPSMEIKYTGRDSRDPSDNEVILHSLAVQTGPAPEAQFPKERFFVSAVIWGSHRPQAIINGKVMNLGEKLEGWEITSIDKKGIHVSHSGQEALLSIK